MMVRKIRKKSKKGPKAPYAVPLVWVQTCLYGIRREGRGFHESLKEPHAIRRILRDHFEQEVVLGERPLTRHEFLEWRLRREPAALAEMFGASGLIPMGPGEPERADDPIPQLGILPILVLVQAREVEPFLARDWTDISEIRRVGLEKLFYATFQLIPGYDLLLSPGPCHGKKINSALEALNGMVQSELERSGLPPVEPFALFSAGEAEKTPLAQPYTRQK